ncbi:MAG: hypothetical protein ACREMX_08345 [Gemmatimonadales bacterium]
MATRTNAFSRRALDSAPSGALRFEAELDGQKVLLDAGAWVRLIAEDVTGLSSERFDLDAQPACLAAAATLLRRTVLLLPPPVRPYFAVCALHGWRRVPARQLAGWSGIPMNTLKRQLAAATLTPAGVAAWNLALHAAWLLDVAALPAGAVVSWMRLGRASALAAVLGARAVRFAAGRVEPGAFAATLDRYVAVLRSAFPT